MLESAPYSSCVEEEDHRKPLLSVLHLWRVTPSTESLHKILRPAKGQLPIIIRAARMSRRKVVMGIWVVSGGEAITVSAYDHKAVESLDITFLCGWWAELGIPPLKSMAISGLCGVAAYLVQGITLQTPEPDRKGRVDMSKASLQFNPGPPPPLFEFGPSQFDPTAMGESKVGTEARKGGRAKGRVVWRGMRTFRQRAVLLACARNGPSMMIVRGWDSSMAWRMTNVVTFHEEDWETWKEVAVPARSLTARYFLADTPPEDGQGGACSPSQSPATAAEEGQDRSRKHESVRHPSDPTTAPAATVTVPEAESSPAANGTDQRSILSSDAGAGTTNAGNSTAKEHPVTSNPSSQTHRASADAAAATNQARMDRLCQAIADRVEVRFEGRGGKLALRAPRRRGEGSSGAGASGGHRLAGGGGEGAAGLHRDDNADDDGDDDGGDGGSDSEGRLYGGGSGGGGGRGLGSDELGNQEKGKGGASIPRQFLSHKVMEERVKSLDTEDARSASTGGPRRPPEDLDSGGLDESLAKLPTARSIKALTRWRGVDGKLHTVEEIVERLAINRREEEALAAARRQEAVRKWKNLGKVLCRLLRMSDYWYGFASDGALLSSEERARRRISVLRQIVEMRGVGRTTMKSLVRAIAARYPRSVWSRFRQLLRLPKAQRNRRDMAVCAILLGEIDNQFFKHRTAGWPFSSLVNLASDVRLVNKPNLSVLYEEGETAPRIIGRELAEAGTVGTPAEQNSLAASACSNGHGTGIAGMGNTGRTSSPGVARRSGVSKGEEQGTHPSPKQQQQQQEERWAVGAYVIMHGSVDIFLLERGPAANLPTAASQENLSAKASRGQPMYRPRPPGDWEAAEGEAEESGGHCGSAARQPGGWRRPAVTDYVEVALSGSGPGPRRARTRSVAPRWKACRLGAGALFGDRPARGSITCGDPQPATSCQFRGTASESAPAAAPGWRFGPALETAITAEETELLEIGVSSYLRYLAEGVGERTHQAVGVLKATEALDGVPTPALARICRYATERTAGQMPVDAAHPPLLNPPPLAVAAQGMSQSEFRHDHESESSDGGDGNSDINSSGSSNRGSSSSNNREEKTRSNILCRKGTFRGTVFFVAEGHGNVVLDVHDERIGFPRDLGGDDGGGSSTESLLAAAAFGNRRTLKLERKRSRRRGNEKVGETKCEDHDASVGYARAGTAAATGAGPAAAGVTKASATDVGQKETDCPADDHTAIAAEVTHPTGPFLDDSHEKVQPSHVPPPSAAVPSISFHDENREEWTSGAGAGGEEEGPSLAALRRGDFFGVDPASPTATFASEQILSLGSSRFIVGSYPNANEDGVAASSPALSPNTAVSAAAGATPPAADDGSTTAKGRTREAGRYRPGLVATADPAAIVAEPSAVPAPTFPGLHMTSLVAGPGGIRCLAVGLGVLQKICPPVHRRLEKAASDRYAGWMAEAKRRNEDDWHESLENESVRSLSRSFYDSFAKGYWSGSVAGNGATGMESSVGWTISDDGGWAGGSVAGGSVAGGSVAGGSRSVLSLDDSGDDPRRRGGGGDASTVQGAAPASIVRSIHSVATTCCTSESKSIFELSRRYIGLALCSSGRSVVPVRLGRAIVDATVPPKTSSSPEPAQSPRAVTGSTRGAGVARRIGPCACAAAVEAIPQVGHSRSCGPAPPAYGGGGGTSAYAGWGEGSSSSNVPIENGWRKRDIDQPPCPTLQRSACPTRAGVDVADTSLRTANNNSSSSSGRDAGVDRVDGGCSRGRRCAASPTRERAGSAEVGALLAKYRRTEACDSPVSPFSVPSSLVGIPLSAAIDPPGFPPPRRADTTAAVMVEGAEGGGQLGGGDSSVSVLADEMRKTSVLRREEITAALQKIMTGRRTSFGWGWKRPEGDRGRRRKQTGLSPRERRLWGGTELRGVFPPTS